MEQLFGRERESAILQQYIDSKHCEFIAIYGRRRVGKTFLVRKFFNDAFDFYVTGFMDGTQKEELDVFNEALKRHGRKGNKVSNWQEAFIALGDLLAEKAEKKKGKLIVFIDELPCFDTRNSKFVSALDYFWNSKGSWIDNLKFIVCGSATSWMIRKVINNKGGLHNRVTHEMHLKPFNLQQTGLYLNANGFKWSRLSVVQMYAAIGGVPYYLSLLDNRKSVPDNIDQLFFAEDAEMRMEHSRLFKSLYKQPEPYVNIVRLLASNKSGLTRKEIADKLKLENNGHLGDILDDLIYCDFVRRFHNGALRNNSIYQLTDFYSLFYYTFGTKRITDTHYWRHLLGTPTENTWLGLAFERICMSHIAQIIRALHFDTIHTEYYSWRSKLSPRGAQIDLIIDRADGNVSLCEIKYSKGTYTLTKAERLKIEHRIESFQSETQCRKGIQPTLITTFGLTPNEHAEIASSVVTLDDLFKPVD